jgi:hypothetical protein
MFAPKSCLYISHCCIYVLHKYYQFVAHRPSKANHIHMYMMEGFFLYALEKKSRSTYAILLFSAHNYPIHGDHTKHKPYYSLTVKETITSFYAAFCSYIVR